MTIPDVMCMKILKLKGHFPCGNDAHWYIDSIVEIPKTQFIDILAHSTAVTLV